MTAAVRSAVWLPLFDELAEPRLIMRIAAAAEEAGWDGLFVWDHVRWREPVEAVADPWTVLAACAAVTERLRLGPMVTPLARRRPGIVARQTATLDRLSAGRLVLGVGLGGDRFGGEYSRFGEEESLRVRAEMTDEALEILRAAWSGADGQPPGTALRRRRRSLPPPAGAGTRSAGLDRRLPRQPGAPPPRRPLRRVLPGQPHPSRRARRGHGRRTGASTGPVRAPTTWWRRSSPARTPLRGSRPAPPGASPTSIPRPRP